MKLYSTKQADFSNTYFVEIWAWVKAARQGSGPGNLCFHFDEA
jgi:hypothetical protein